MAKQTRRRRIKMQTNETLHVNTTGGAVRISQPASERVKPTAKEKAAVVVDVVTPKAVTGFFGFLRENSVVGVGVGLVIGTQLKAITDSLNSGFISPLFGLLFDGGELKDQRLAVTWRGETAQLDWGLVAYQIIDFLFVMVAIYVIIKFFMLDRLDKKKK